MSLRTIVAAVVGAVVGGATVWFLQTASFRLTPANMTYPELAAVLLTAVAVIVAMFAGVVGLAAVWGFKQLKEDAVTAAGKAGLESIREQIENGPLKDYIQEEIERLTIAEIESDRMERRIKHRVDEVTFGRPVKDRLLEDDE